ncbi:hypothetical protein D9M73_281120 [compost metagenome]
MHQLMPGQVLQRAWYAIADQVGGAGTVAHAQLPDRPRHHVQVMQGTNAHHAVKPFAQQVDLAIGATELHFQAREALQKLR